MEQVQAAKRIFESFLRVFKMFKLYPESTPNRQQAIAKMHSELSAYLAQNSFLGFEIQKKAVLFFGEVIREKTGTGGDFIFTLYHEGIKWLEFQEGIGLDEIEKLFKILDDYSKPFLDNPEQDLVTRLWEAQLPNLVFHDGVDGEELLPAVEQYREKLKFLKEKTIQEICSYLLTLPEDPEFAGKTSDADPDTFGLESGEETELQRLKQEHYLLDPLSEVFGALAYVCGQKNESELLSCILDLLRVGTSEALKSLDIGRSNRILMTLRQLSKLCGKQHWASQSLENSIEEISKAEDITILIAGIKDPEKYPLDELKKFLIALNPIAIHTILPAIPQIWSPLLRGVVMDVIQALASRDIGQLEKIPKDSEEDLIFILIEVLGKLKTQRAAEVLIGLTGHPSDSVVTYGIKTLAVMDGWFPFAVFKMVEHPGEKVQMAALEYLGSRKCNIAERLLITFLESDNIKGIKQSITLQCFRALGSCGSSSAYAFLRNILAGRKWYGKIFRSIEAEGAVLALQIMGTEDAMQVLPERYRKPIASAITK